MLRIVCVQKGNYLGRGVEYVNILHDMVRRNLPAGTEGEFAVFTDELATGYHPDIVQRPLPADGIKGWWNKLWLFSPGLFDDGDRVVFFDLDTLVIGALDEVVQYDGEFAMLRDFYRPDGMQSSAMLWRAGFGAHLWNEYIAEGKPTHDLGGDQSWIEARTEPDVLQDLFPASFVSFKAHCKPFPPKGARVVVFHGQPRPHEVAGGWVPDVWRVGGIGSLEILVRCNTETEALKRNIEHALSLGLPEVKEAPAHDRPVCIVGGAPSLLRSLPELKARADNGQEIWVLNNAAQTLIDHGIRVDGQWIVDARPENAKFVQSQGMKYLASQCAPATFEAARGNVTVYHEISAGEFIPTSRGVTLIGGGTTVGMNAIAGAYALGYRKMHIYGMDSSFDGDAHHAYAQPQNDADYRISVSVEGDATFEAAAWMIRQAEDFQGLAAELANMGCEIHVHCGGLLGYVSRKMMEYSAAPDEVDGEIERYRGWWRPVGDEISVPAVLGEVWKIKRVVEALPVTRRRTAIQAGGHVGIFPAHLAEIFKKVHTFEPDPKNFRCLTRNTKHWNITLHSVALGDSRGSLALIEREANNAGSIGVDPGKAGDIQVRRIDDFRFKDVDLIYLDIEGMEGPALWGAMETVKKYRPLIVCENKGLDVVSGSDGTLATFIAQAGYVKVSRLMRDDVFAPAETASIVGAQLAA